MEQSSLNTPISLPPVLPAIPHASTNEKLIVGKLVTDLLAAGFTLSVWDGEEMTVVESTDTAEIFPALSSTDMDTLYVHTPNRPNRPRFLTLVWGNDCHVISDYNTSLESLISGANSFADELEDTDASMRAAERGVR